MQGVVEEARRQADPGGSYPTSPEKKRGQMRVAHRGGPYWGGDFGGLRTLTKNATISLSPTMNLIRTRPPSWGQKIWSGRRPGRRGVKRDLGSSMGKGGGYFVCRREVAVETERIGLWSSPSSQRRKSKGGDRKKMAALNSELPACKSETRKRFTAVYLDRSQP